LKTKLLAVFASVAMLAGCAAPAPQVTEIHAPFDAAETAALMKPGPNTITGSALIRQQGGGVVTCAGNPVLLIPATAYSKERVAAIYGGGGLARTNQGRKFNPDPPGYAEHTKQTTCNAQGFFRFAELADGEFFLITRVVWSAGRYNTEQGGYLLGRARVSGGRTVEVTITP
jgi:hypothetical protein